MLLGLAAFKLRRMEPLYLNGRPTVVTERSPIDVEDKFTGDTIAQVSRADAALVLVGIGHAERGRAGMAGLSVTERGELLDRAAGLLEAREPGLVAQVVAEGGKPITAARAEFSRTVNTFRVAAAEARALDVSDVPLSPLADGRRARVKRFPIGAVGMITPFNFPLNLVAHKVAPAIAAGCPFVLKPATSTPLSALTIARVLAEVGLPGGAFSVLPARGEAAEALATDERLAKLSFTGSDSVGWALKSRAGKKRVTLELGGNAAVIVDQDVDLTGVAERIVAGAFGQAGQSCISVQRVIAVDAVYDELRTRLIARTREVQAGDPRDEDTVVGPLISAADGERVKTWIDEAVAGGATVLAGGERDGALVEATLVEGAKPGMKVLDEEIFGPVAVLQRAASFDAAIQEANRTRFGLQVGVFSGDERHVASAWDRLEVGGVIVDDVPTWRDDAMPYGGIKDSGLGREGPRSAIEEMTEPRVIVRRS